MFLAALEFGMSWKAGLGGAAAGDVLTALVLVVSSL
jgi:hypothetical protein